MPSFWAHQVRGSDALNVSPWNYALRIETAVLDRRNLIGRPGGASQGLKAGDIFPSAGSGTRNGGCSIVNQSM